jgi:hypothetical protein
MKNVGLVVFMLVLKFGDHRRWSELAARGGASGVSWWPGLAQKFSFSGTDTLMCALVDFVEI